MRVQFVSDLHLEFPASGGTLALENVEGRTDLLVLAGDICTAKKAARGEFEPFFRHCAETFPRVVYIAGNHEFYGGDIEDAHDQLRAAVRVFPNISYLDRESVCVGAFNVWGATMWTDCNGNHETTKQMLKYGMNDYRAISCKSKQHWKLQPEDTYAIHKESLAALERHLEAAEGPTLVVTHHAPTRLSLHPRYANDDFMNGGYQSDLIWLMQKYPGIPFWIHGHTHDSFCYKAPGTETIVRCNPRGYVTSLIADGENPAFDPRKVVEL